MRRRYLWIVIGILIFSALFRIGVAHWLANDNPGDGLIYAQMARNLLEQHVFSHDAQAPYNPSLVRLPGYPIFLSGIYAIFGHTNNGAVRIVQALIDTATCGLIAILAFYWQPDEKKKWASAIGALALAAICPFTTIYAATILTEVPTNFLMMAMFLAATFALRNRASSENTAEEKRDSLKRAVRWWLAAGLIGGISVFFRPDNGLFVAAVGLTLALGWIWRSVASAAWRPFALPADAKKNLAQMLLCGTLFSIAFVLVLAPWTIRNWRLFHVFQPLAPAHAEMPGEFVPRGYQLWVRSWIDDDSFISPFLWALDTDPIKIADVPPYAYDSPEEKNRIAALLYKYNHPDAAPADPDNLTPKLVPAPQPSPSVSPEDKSTSAGARPSPSDADDEASGDSENEESDQGEPEK